MPNQYLRLIANRSQLPLFDLAPFMNHDGPRLYGSALTVSLNHKGVIDVDTVKGCTLGMRASPDGGCYGECYACKIAAQYGIDFRTSVKRELVDQWEHRDRLIAQLLKVSQTWYRIGVMGDPSHYWNHTVRVIGSLHPAHKTAVVVTKHWMALSDDNISRLIDQDVVIHTSTSGMDSNEQIEYRVGQMERLRSYGIPAVNRVVTCEYGPSAWGDACRERQTYLLSVKPVIDNPLRVSKSNDRVISGDILTTNRKDSIGGGKTVSLHAQDVYLGHCDLCPDQCGVELSNRIERTGGPMENNISLFDEDIATHGEAADVKFVYVEKIIGSGFEEDVAKLALEDGIAHRAARKNMQIHSAVMLLIGDKFSGFFTFQNNHDINEFCLLQSVIEPEHHTDELYLRMCEEVIKQNTQNYPALMTTNPKSKFETPALFEILGFETYLKMGGFHYMLKGETSYARMKLLSHITMTNVWNSTKGDWLRLKKQWNEHIKLAGVNHEIENPTYATREGCWQGVSGFANVVTGRAHNHNASVLDPVSCEVILRFFMPTDGKCVYNPFGGGVQFGYVTGASGYEYFATEIRKNQCDANNAICSEFEGVEWVVADSSKYRPDRKFDLVFACPPYYRVEKYTDYDGESPDGEINSLPTYEEFRETLFAGYEIAIDSLNDNRFIAIMTGDSRDATGAYHCHEAETEVFFKKFGLAVYNKIIYVESAFTRLAQAKKTLNYRKFPKQEQRIIIAYKGDMKEIINEFPTIGRL